MQSSWHNTANDGSDAFSSDSHGNGYPNAVAYPDIHGNWDGHPHTHCHGHPDGYSDAHPDSVPHGFPNALALTE